MLGGDIIACWEESDNTVATFPKKAIACKEFTSSGV